MARAELFDTIEALSFSTFGGNPLSAAGGLATLRHVLDNDLQGNALRMGKRLVDGLAPVVERTPWIAELRGRGLMQAMEMVQPGSIDPDANRAGAVLEGARRHDLLVGKGGLYGNAIRIAPMLNVTEDEIDEGVAALIAAIEAAGG